MIVSRCCKDDLYIEQGFYFCKNCNIDCDTIFVTEEIKDDSYDARNAAEIEKSTSPA